MGRGDGTPLSLGRCSRNVLLPSVSSRTQESHYVSGGSVKAELLQPKYNSTESGYGYGLIDGGGDGYGDSEDSWLYVKAYCGKPIYNVDGVPTMIYSVRHGVAFGATLRADLTTTPCVIVKSGHVYAHGTTLREATEALRDKLCDGMNEEERIAAFWECHNRTDKYSGRDLWYWHHRLTGSCEFGRNEFAKNHSINIDNSEFTVAEFVELCKDSYGGDVIRKLVK